MRVCAYPICRESLEGRRRDTTYCKPSHRALDHRRRVEETLVRETSRMTAAEYASRFREVVREYGTPDQQDAYETLSRFLPFDFERANAGALKRAAENG